MIEASSRLWIVPSLQWRVVAARAEVAVPFAGQAEVDLQGRGVTVALLARHHEEEVPVRIEGSQFRSSDRGIRLEVPEAAMEACCTFRERLDRDQAEGSAALAVDAVQTKHGRAENRLAAAVSRKNSEQRLRAKDGMACLA